jgi:hypothetical protein
MLVKLIYLKSLPAPHNTRENNQNILTCYIEIQIAGGFFEII